MDIRNEILKIVKKEPKATAEIIEKLKEIAKDNFIQENESKFYHYEPPYRLSLIQTMQPFAHK